MTNDIGILRAKLRKALDNVGRNNGHACPETSSNIDPTLHELFVAGEAVSYWKTRHEEAKEAALAIGDGLDDAVQSVIDTNSGTSVTLASGDLYTMTCDIKRPAMRLNQTALRNYMQTQLGLDKAAVDKAFDACSTASAPAKTIKVASR